MKAFYNALLLNGIFIGISFSVGFGITIGYIFAFKFFG